MKPERTNFNHALIAFAIALAVGAFMFAATNSEKARHSTPEYWHYKHHWSTGTNPNCDENCKFMGNNKNKEPSTLEKEEQETLEQRD